MSTYSYQRKLLVYYVSVFFLFLLISGGFQYNREKEYRVGKLETTLDNIVELTRKYVDKYDIEQNHDYDLLDSLQSLIPEENSRTTIISKEGVVLYDSYVRYYDTLENHYHRPEIILARQEGKGSSIRKSSSTGKTYYYYAKKTDLNFIRASVVYDVTVVNFLKANKLFFYFVFMLFILVFIMLWWVTKQLTLSVSTLKDFSINAAQNQDLKKDIEFPNDEIGIIGQQIVNIYEEHTITQKKLLLEKERLYRHLAVIGEGIALFSSNKKVLLHNRNFINYINLIEDKLISIEHNIFPVKAFKKLNKFIDSHLGHQAEIKTKEELEEQIKIHKNNKHFSVKCIIFSDKSFEIIITNITKREKNKIIKKEITANIAHELKTPLSAIHGYLETILYNPTIDQEKRLYFINKAFNQVGRLNYLINDITTIEKLDDAVDFFKKENVNLYDLIEDIAESEAKRLKENKVQLKHDFKPSFTVQGNRELLYSIFRNFIENTINYAGNGIEIKISQYMEDDNYYYFSFSDTGKGVNEKHLNRIFERFYRGDRGRTRQDGGTGLGLSIVKNAVQFHEGKISAKSKKEGGITFLFTLKKVIETQKSD